LSTKLLPFFVVVVLIRLEAEYDQKLKELQSKHQDELKKEGGGSTGITNPDDDAEQDPSAANKVDDGTTTEETAAASASADNNSVEVQLVEKDELQRQKKVAANEKARRKREKAREKERERQRQIDEETANAGPLPRDVENSHIESQLRPLNLKIVDVEADGHCLYRAVAAQCNSNYVDMRK